MNWKFFRAKRDPAWNEIIDHIKAYDNTDHKSMLHVRTDEHTVLLLNQLKLATGIDITKIVAFSVSELVRQHPELRIIIKQFLQKLNE
jgi:hypothetical protein